MTLLGASPLVKSHSAILDLPSLLPHVVGWEEQFFLLYLGSLSDDLLPNLGPTQLIPSSYLIPFPDLSTSQPSSKQVSSQEAEKSGGWGFQETGELLLEIFMPSLGHEGHYQRPSGDG